MKRLNINVGALDRAFQQAPEVFQPVRVNMALGVANRMVDDLMNIILVHADIGAKRIGMQFRAFKDVLANVALDFVIARRLQHLQLDPRRLAARRALKQPLNGRHALPTRILFLFGLVHEARATADKRFVGLDATAHFGEGTFLHRQSDTVKHEPSGLLRHAKGAANLVRTDAVLRVHDEPDSREPLAQGKRTVVKDRAHLHRKLFFARLAVAHHTLAGKRAHFGRSAVRALRLAVRPNDGAHEGVSAGRIGEKGNGFLERFGRGFLFHASNIAREVLGVKYIITKKKPGGIRSADRSGFQI